jgi:hypothetical protein
MSSRCHHFSSVVRPSTFHILISPQKPLDQLQSNFGGMVPGWVPFKIVSNSPALHSRWPLLLKIEISSNGQNCSILSQNVSKFELYKHNDELFSKYDRFHPPFFLFLAWRPSWLEVGITGHNFGRGPSKNHFSKVWLRLAQ